MLLRHPNYYKELRKRALDERNKTDQVISPTRATAPSRRAPGPGLKRQASSSGLSMRGDRGKPTAASLRPELQASSAKLKDPQATSDKHQAPSNKRQA
jgi:hypothetical protein